VLEVIRLLGYVKVSAAGTCVDGANVSSAKPMPIAALGWSGTELPGGLSTSLNT
jgi:hypothetical protein